MELFAVRHGETIFNREHRMTGGEGDSPLTENGIRQALELGNLLQKTVFDAAYTSPLGRAADTVRIALQGRYPVTADNRLVEIGLGAMHGMGYDEAVRAYPQSGLLFLTDPDVYIPPPGGEPLTDMLERLSSFLRDLSVLPYARVFVSTHGTVLRVLYSLATDGTVAAMGRAPSFGNCAVMRLTDACGKWALG